MIKRAYLICMILFISIIFIACNSIINSNNENNAKSSKLQILYPYKSNNTSDKSFKYGYIDEEGKVIVEPKYDYADYASENQDGYYRVKIGDKWGMINSKGDNVIKVDYEELSDFSEGLAAAKLNGKYGYIDMKGNTIISFQFDQANNFSEGKALVNSRDREIIDKEGKVLAKNLKYSFLSGFHNGRAAISMNNEFGYIDENFNIIVEPKYKIAKDFVNGIALVGYSIDEFYLINTKGDTVVEFPKGKFKLDFRAQINNEELFPVIKDGKEGYMDLKGNLKIDCIYDYASKFKNGYAITVKDKKTCVIDSTGKLITDSLPQDYLKIGIVGNLVMYDGTEGTSYYTITGNKVFNASQNNK